MFMEILKTILSALRYIAERPCLASGLKRSCLPGTETMLKPREDFLGGNGFHAPSVHILDPTFHYLFGLMHYPPSAGPADRVSPGCGQRKRWVNRRLPAFEVAHPPQDKY